MLEIETPFGGGASLKKAPPVDADGKSDKYAAPALEKGLDILELLSQSTVPLNLTQIASQLNRSISEIQRMVGCLWQRGYIVRGEQATYRLSSKLFRLATTHPPFRDLLSRAMPHMEWFASEVGQSVHLGILDQDRLLLLGEAAGHSFACIRIRMGEHQSAVETMSGRILLTGLDAQGLDEFLHRQQLTPEAEQTIRQDIGRIAKDGYDLVYNSLYRGTVDLGVPVIVRDQVIAALASCWIERNDEQDHWKQNLPALQEVARRIAQSYEPEE